MKKVSIAVLLIISFLFQSCLKDKITHTYTILTPIYKTKDEVYANLKSNAPEQIQSPGKIFLYGNYIFLNEVDKGVHIIDNTDPKNPVIKAFINIPGNLDIAVKGNVLYADMYQDLVAVEVSDPLQAKLLKDIPNVFPERSYANGFVADNSRIIVGWNKKDTTVDVQLPSGNYLVYTYTPNALGAAANAAAAAKGISGSMARFTIVDDYLFAVDHHTLRSISISDTHDPVVRNETSAGWDIETIYPFENKLFLGSMGGMFVFDISQPENPVNEGSFVHARACDPVITDGNYAYITLREGTICGASDNELQVVNVKNLQSPSLVKTYPLTNPFGLTKDNNRLFICDGTNGLKMYDASDPSNLILKKHIGGLETYDAIAWNNNLIVVAKDGLYEYDYSTQGDLVKQGKLSINN
jgi:hypothetical protein